jgi:heterotetrameric sarcosine oxidase gamma subunit
VRERVGMIDVSTLGKLDVKGADTGKLLDKVYTNRFSDLRPGRVRYAVMCDEAGIMLDDGTISRLSEDRYFITTTTGNLDFVQQWLEWWLAASGWDVHITNVTGGFAAVNVAGPLAREVLQKLTFCDLSTHAFPYMSCLETEVAGIPALLLRIGFVGETGWEIHYPADSGAELWQALLEAGSELGIQPFGNIPVRTPSTKPGKPFWCDQFDVSVTLLSGDRQVCIPSVHAIASDDFDEEEEGVQAIIGRDILDRCVSCVTLAQILNFDHQGITHELT